MKVYLHHIEPPRHGRWHKGYKRVSFSARWATTIYITCACEMHQAALSNKL